MRKKIVLFALLFVAIGLQAQDFATYFEPQRLRVDLVLAGNAEQQYAYLEDLHAEPQWGGSTKNLVDKFDYGEYCYKVFSVADSKLIYSRGFNTLFSEWRTTDEARHVSRAMPVSLILPMPKAALRLEVYERVKKTGEWKQLFAAVVNPADKQIRRDKPNDYVVTQLLNNGDPTKKVDVVFVAEGYTAAEMDKFRADAARFAASLFEFEPYSARREDFNIWAVESPSADSGPDIPHQEVWSTTVADASFFTFGIDRYMTSPNHTKICELAWNVPYDQIYVIVNTTKYGGGGIYNSYGMSMADHALASEVFVHEFGHQFAGLGDEYFNAEVAYEDFYNLALEPWEPNITTMVSFDKKWKNMLDKKTPVPTPNEEKYAGVVGVFEGGGYVTKGVYRPMLNCRMRSNGAVFCPVCQHAIEQMIDSYIK